MFNKKTAIITGGASGIGRALAYELCARGAIVIIADRQAETGNQACAEISEAFPKARIGFETLDVSHFEEVDRLVKRVVDQHGRLDLMFNNAGVAVGGYAEDYLPEDWGRVFRVNIDGVAHGVHCALAVMRKQKSGHIVNVASAAGLIPSPFAVAYTASKHAVVGLSRALRPEAKMRGVCVSVVCPGVVRTPILAAGGEFGRMASDIPTDVVMENWEKGGPVSAEKSARIILKGVLKNREIIMVPGKIGLLWRVERFFPSFLTRHIFKQGRKAFGDPTTPLG